MVDRATRIRAHVLAAQPVGGVPMITLTGGSANELYTAACRAVSRDGLPVSPRGMDTTEVLGAHLCLTDPRRRLVDLPPARVINPAFAIAETLWILSGSGDPWIFQYN